MDKNGRLGDLRLGQILHSAMEHDVGQRKAQDVIGFLEEVAVCVVQVLGHSGALSALAGEDVCLHSP